MKNFQSQGLRYDGRLLVLDQTCLPDQENWIHCQSPEHMIECIQSLRVRGAPLIGVAAAVSLALYAESGASLSEVLNAGKALRDARPTAVNLMAAIDRMVSQARSVNGSSRDLTASTLTSTAETIFDEDVELCLSMGKLGADLIQDGDGILTHCNAGGLATVGIGTAVGVIRTAFEQGKRIHVFVDETRPLLQGGRLTAWELSKLGIPHTLICDNMSAMVMRQGRIQKIFVGADRIAANGDFANKIGTYGVGVLAKHHGIPLYPVAPYTTVDLHCADGSQIPIEERQPKEVRGASGFFGEIRWAPSSSPVFNPAFDVTPVDLVEALVLDSGVYDQKNLRNGCLKQVLKNP